MRARTRPRLLPLVLLSAACGGLGFNLREPDIQLDRAVVRGVDLSGGNLDLVVKVENPNNFTLQGTKLQVGVDVEGSHLGDVTYDNDFAVSEGPGHTEIARRCPDSGLLYPRGARPFDPLEWQCRHSGHRTIITSKVTLSDH